MILLSLLSVFLGWITIVALVVMGQIVVGGPVLGAGGGATPAPAPELHAFLSQAWPFVAAVAGGFVTAWIAPRAPLRHAMGLAVMVAAMASAFVFAGPFAGGPGEAALLLGVPVAGILAGGALGRRLGDAGPGGSGGGGQSSWPPGLFR